MFLQNVEIDMLNRDIQEILYYFSNIHNQVLQSLDKCEQLFCIYKHSLPQLEEHMGQHTGEQLEQEEQKIVVMMADPLQLYFSHLKSLTG